MSRPESVIGETTLEQLDIFPHTTSPHSHLQIHRMENGQICVILPLCAGRFQGGKRTGQYCTNTVRTGGNPLWYCHAHAHLAEVPNED